MLMANLPLTDLLPLPTAPDLPRRAHVITYGCQMNVYDSARMLDVIRPSGFVRSDTAADADLVILNTCHIRERAAEKLFSELGRIRVLQNQAARDGRRMMIAVAGCVAQAEGAQIAARAPYVDIVFGPQTYHRLPDMLVRAQGGGTVIETDFPADDKFDYLPEAAAPQTAGGLTAFLTVQEGCDKFCSFCVVPFTRGAEVSRSAAAILAEAGRMTAGGAREITLLGQNVNAWHGAALPDAAGQPGSWNFARLVEALAALPGLARIRYTTSHPNDMDAGLIAAHRDQPALMPFLHLPVQSGSDRMLAAMNRKHTAAHYIDIVGQLRAARPDIALSSDFIVGHPGETDADFTATLDLVREIRFAQAFTFKYSPRPGTVAATRDGQVPEAVKDARLQVLQALIRVQQQAFNTGCVGRTLAVLLTHRGRHPGQIVGRSPYLQPVHIQASPDLIGTEQQVTITHTNTNSLSGMLVPSGQKEHSPA